MKYPNAKAVDFRKTMDRFGGPMKLSEVKEEDVSKLSMTQLDTFHEEIVAQRAEYENYRKKSQEAYAFLKESQARFIAILEGLGRTSYKSRFGLFSYHYPERFKLKDKLGFFDWFRTQYGEDSLVSLQSINSQTLNGWGKAYIAEQTDEGIIDVQVPGLEKSTGEPIASMRIAN